MPASKKVVGQDARLAHRLRLRAREPRPWPWPRAALAIILLSLLLWAGLAVILLIAFD